MPRRSLPILLLVAGVLAVSAPAQARARTYLPSCSYANTYKPHAVNVFCGDAGVYISKVHWSSWGSRSAHGAGRADVKSCDPNCATGRVEHRRARLTLSRVRTCPSTGKRVFTRITVAYAGGTPRPLRQKVLCRNRPAGD